MPKLNTLQAYDSTKLTIHDTTTHDTTRHGREPTSEPEKPARRGTPQTAMRGAADITARLEQVNALREGVLMPAIVKPWPTPSTQTTATWAKRHPAFRTTTGDYQSTQQRMLWLMEVAHDDRMASFERECYERKLKPTTAESYWTSWLSACKTIGEEVRPSDKAHQKALKKRAVQPVPG
jgi:hypothetical protein